MGFCWPDFCVMLCQVFSLYYTSIYYLLSLCFPSASMFGFLRLFFFQGLISTSFFNNWKLQKKMATYKNFQSSFFFLLRKTRTLFKFPFLIERSKWNCVLNSTVLPWKNELHTKGQLISEANFKVYIWTKNQTRIFL